MLRVRRMRDNEPPLDGKEARQDGEITRSLFSAALTPQGRRVIQRKASRP